jgi:hypothetical protein
VRPETSDVGVPDETAEERLFPIACHDEDLVEMLGPRAKVQEGVLLLG